VARGINPRLWDLHWVKKLDDETHRWLDKKYACLRKTRRRAHQLRLRENFSVYRRADDKPGRLSSTNAIDKIFGFGLAALGSKAAWTSKVFFNPSSVG
jgi:hypothetical protein